MAEPIRAEEKAVMGLIAAIEEGVGRYERAGTENGATTDVGIAVWAAVVTETAYGMVPCIITAKTSCVTEVSSISQVVTRIRNSRREQENRDVVVSLIGDGWPTKKGYPTVIEMARGGRS